MEKYINRELKDSIESLQVRQGTSKEGTSYYYISLVLNNNFEKRIYAQSAEQFAFCNAFDLMDTQKQVDVNFNN